MVGWMDGWMDVWIDGSIICWAIFEWLSDWWLLNKDSAAWSLLVS
jgi:hypothetical protein